jgi:hypothetical protein
MGEREEEGTMSGIRDMPLSRFGKVEGNVFTIRGPEVLKGTGIRALDIGLAAAATAGVIYYKMGNDGKKIKIGTPTPKDTGPKALRAKPDPVKRAADRTQDYQKKARGGPIKKYAKGSSVRKAVRY